MKRATAEDARILLQLLEIHNSPQWQEAMTWFTKEFSAKNYQEFKSKYPEGSEGAMHVGQILGSFETAGVFVSHGLLNEDLYFDLSGIGFMWKKLEKIVSGMQKETDPSLWENAAWLAERQKQWKKDVWKPSLAWKLKSQNSRR